MIATKTVSPRQCTVFPDPSEKPEKSFQFFPPKMKLLIVEDDENNRACLKGIFTSPYIQVQTAITADEALLAIASAAFPWHCWIIEINLEKRSGLDIIAEHRNFPGAVIYSGLGSMEIAAKAIQLGAAEVIDKTRDSIHKLIMKTCELMPLSHLCQGILPKNKSVFYLLKENIIKNHNEWAAKANLSLRQLQNICHIHTGLPPTSVIPFYYGMQYLLASSFKYCNPPSEHVSHQFFFQDCVDFITKNRLHFEKHF
jgi:ActR/RegA family two-component response regulator